MSKLIRNTLASLVLSLNVALASEIVVIDKSRVVDKHFDFYPAISFIIDRVYDCNKNEEEQKGGISIVVYDKDENLACKTSSDPKGYAECRLPRFGVYTVFVNHPISINYKPKYSTLNTTLGLDEKANWATILVALDNCDQ